MKEKGHEQDLPGLLGRAGPTSTTCSQCGANLAAGETNGTTGALDQAVRNTDVVAHLSTFAGLVLPFDIYPISRTRCRPWAAARATPRPAERLSTLRAGHFPTARTEVVPPGKCRYGERGVRLYDR